MADRDDLIRRVDALESRMARLEGAALSEEEIGCAHTAWRYLDVDHPKRVFHDTQCDSCGEHGV